MNSFTQYIQQLFANEVGGLFAAEPAPLREARQQSMDFFLAHGLPTRKMENWRQCPIDGLVQSDYRMQREADPYRPVEEYFQCQVRNLATQMFPFLNGWFVHPDAPLTKSANGVITGSVAAAVKQCPELILPYLTTTHADKADRGLVALNEALFNDGLFIYIPANVKVEEPLQLVSMINTDDNLLINNHNVIILGKNASLSFVHCDDSIKYGKTLINNVTEVHLAQNAVMHYYKTENKDADSLLVNHLFVRQQENSEWVSNVVTFNAGYIHNAIHLDLDEPFAHANLYGLYLVDKSQVVDNQVFVAHNAPDCSSYQMYKGIADDSARANFNGHIVVRQDSQRTQAYQTNRNMALTDEAVVTTHPFLEIYADDVKCSHGATVGQLNEDAMFYLRSRGIGERTARMLLMYAFANEVTDKVTIDSLRERLANMVERRLSGELTLCDQCRLHTSDGKLLIFDVDPDKI